MNSADVSPATRGEYFRVLPPLNRENTKADPSGENRGSVSLVPAGGVVTRRPPLPSAAFMT